MPRRCPINAVSLSIILILFQDNKCQPLSTAFHGLGHICDLAKRLEKGCTELVPEIRSPVECAYSCQTKINCTGISVDDNGKCFTHKDCPSISTCSIKNMDHRYFSASNCDNGGYWVPDKMACQCQNGWVGAFCQEYPTSCQSLIESGYPNGNHRVFLDFKQNGEKPRQVTCGIVKPSYTQVLVLWNGGRTDFNRSWDEYVNGFDDKVDNPSMWIGLETWHVASKAGYTTLFTMSSVENQGHMYRHYRDFQIGGQTSGYSFTHGEHLENKNGKLDRTNYIFGDCLANYQNVSFSSYDHDADDLPDENCAATIGSGWWYKDCNSPCNLLGWGTQFWDIKEPAQRMRILGYDTDKERDKEIEIRMFAVYKNY